MSSIQDTLQKAVISKLEAKKERPVVETITVKTIFARSSRGYQCGNTILRPTKSLEIIPKTPEEEEKVKELLATGAFFEASKSVVVNQE